MLSTPKVSLGVNYRMKHCIWPSTKIHCSLNSVIKLASTSKVLPTVVLGMVSMRMPRFHNAVPPLNSRFAIEFLHLVVSK